MKRVLPFALALGIGACTSLPPKRPVRLPLQATRPLTPDAQKVLDREGFVIVESDRDRPASFHLGYSAIFRAHQPVYITADALLYAWHRSYDDALAMLETRSLAPALGSLMRSIRQRVAEHEVGPIRADLDTYLAVGESLLSGAPARDEKAAALVTRAEAAEGPGDVTLFGRSMPFDFSMMKPRGHYTRSIELARYFRAMSWLGRVELRIAETGPDGRMQTNPTALAAVRMLRASIDGGAERTWKMLDGTIGALVGPRDSMSIPEWDTGDLEHASTQRIDTQLRDPSHRSIAFVLLGQRYVFDSHVFGALTYGSLQTKRMMPTPLDVAYTVFANPSAKKLLDDEVKTWGPEYARALDGLVAERDRAGDALWNGSVAHRWLASLRELSPDAERDASLPATFKSDAWGRRMQGTQLASWAELRHDDILYAKQSFTAYAACDYPYGYVDPYPRFWASLASMAAAARATVTPLDPMLAKHFARFEDAAGRLRVMAERERRDEPLTKDDIDFLNHMVSVEGRSGGCTTVLTAEGWYADLFFDRDGALYHEPIIADVHTQPTDADGNVVGRVLHVGTSYPRLLAVSHSGRTYRGFVSAYAEETTSGFERLDDSAWQRAISVRRPAPPPWMRDLVTDAP